MLDYGSNVFLITDVEARRIGIPILRHKIALNTANGSSTILGVTPPLLLSYGSKERELLTRHCMLVIKATPSTCFDLLIGNADCAELRAVHDTGFNTLSLYPVMRDPLIFNNMSYPSWISALLPSDNHDNANPSVGIIDGTSAFLAANHAVTLEALHVLETIQTQLRVDVNYWNAYNKHLGVAALLDALTVVVKTSDLFTHDPMCDVHPIRMTFSIHLLLKSRPLNAFNAYDSSETLQYIAGIFAYYIREGSECPLLRRACNLSNPNVELKYLSRPRDSAFMPSDVPPVVHHSIRLTSTIDGYTSATVGFREALIARIRYDRHMLSDEQPFAVIGICILFPDPCALWLHGIYPRPLRDTEVSTPYDDLDPIPAISFSQVRSFIIPSLSKELNKELQLWDSSLAYPSFMRSATLPSPTMSTSEYSNINSLQKAEKRRRFSAEADIRKLQAALLNEERNAMAAYELEVREGRMQPNPLFQVDKSSLVRWFKGTYLKNFKRQMVKDKKQERHDQRKAGDAQCDNEDDRRDKRQAPVAPNPLPHLDSDGNQLAKGGPSRGFIFWDSMNQPTELLWNAEDQAAYLQHVIKDTSVPSKVALTTFWVQWEVQHENALMQAHDPDAVANRLKKWVTHTFDPMVEGSDPCFAAVTAAFRPLQKYVKNTQ
ncbi:hypothetical protein CEUSTIGMA_g13761.t1 [Chlamydomonas eustigma]|uniref:Uncharacterized protein n=1 Tax=Chlamydomonas eustigma TaxID=1157962 RepID=A0A250XTQ0_9CHLO|nr:hypothetical protein CEUSTIGMA_g13761.t1 [Chlamydomonas eustigma]|eukprot:GAX86349.1 hypothetical protein CEUSTIGMA_g13761.t1 [Chlamydomonas eustigma]